MTKPFFHELTRDQMTEIWKACGKVPADEAWEEIRKTYAGPAWCGQGDYAFNPWGCWSLALGDSRISPEFCSNCEFYEQHPDPE